MTDSTLYIGLISGTSVDGIDCVLVDFASGKPELLSSHCHLLQPSLRASILDLCGGENLSLKDIGNTHIAIGRAFAEATSELLAQAGVAANDIAAIGSHGQTIWHHPQGDTPFTLQLGDGNTIAQATGITTIADMRGRDMAAGGQGAPLAPLLHREMFYSQNVDRAIINIGGISNITALPRNSDAIAFDTGPGNVLMDYWIDKHQGEAFDRDGAWAAQGQFNLSLLNALLHESYFSQAIPKSTGRELFNGPWLEAKLADLGLEIEPVDVQATLLTFTVTTIVSDLSQLLNPQEIYICGGGAYNKTVMQELSKVASDCSVLTTEDLGISPDWVEAIAFAWMARETLAGRAIDTSAFTGASQPVILGAIYQA